MSGGHFDYIQSRIEEAANEIEEIIKNNNNKELDEFGYAIGYNFSDATIEKFKEAEKTVRKAAKMIQRIDWLISDDDGEETFHERWKEENL